MHHDLPSLTVSQKLFLHRVPIISFNVDEPRIRRELQRTGKNLPNDEDFDAVFNQSFFKESNTGVGIITKLLLFCFSSAAVLTFAPISFSRCLLWNQILQAFFK